MKRAAGLLVLLVLSSTLGRAAEHFEVKIERGVAVKMHDGVVLRADIYRPKAEGKFPVLLQRTPYDKANGVDTGPRAAARGYVVIVQDCRGRFDSEGEWYPFKNESQDGYDTVEWAASLPYVDGKVGMFGASYIAATQMLAAIAQPLHLAGVFSYVTASNYHEGWTYQGGAFEQCFNEVWASYFARDTLNRRLAHVNAEQLVWQLVWKLPLASFSLFSFPLFDPGTAGPQGLAPYFFDWLAHPSYDDYWKQWSIEDHHGKLLVPVYNIGAWYDIFLGGTLRNYTGIKANGGSDAARRGQRLLVTVGSGHAGVGRKIGDVDFGPDAEISESDIDEVMLHWYDHLLKGIANGEEREKPVKIFVMGKNIWREEDDWPLGRARNTRFSLHSQGAANGLNGDGALSAAGPEAEPPDRFVYDPADPVLTRGGNLACGLPRGPFDQRPNEARRDVLVYSTPAFKENFEVTGPVSVELHASSSAVDTDFTAKLVDVWPNGFAQNLTDGIQRMRYRNSPGKAEFMTPGEIYKVTLDLWATSNLFRAGHKLRLEISSSNFPRFDRNLNTGEDPGSATRMVKATNTVYHDREHPSALILPVVPR